MKKLSVVLIIFVVGLYIFNSHIYNEKQSEDETLQGYIVMGHEVRTLTPCGHNAEELWILGNSVAYNTLLSTYQSWSKEQDDPYKPLFVNIIGNITDAPTDGFGMDYNYGFNAIELVDNIPNGICN